jgi:dTDP-4-dehydrorhamnose 3,5-epimerase
MSASPDVRSLAIADVKLLRPRRFSDARGFFAETWNRRTFAAAGIDVDFVQDNCSFSEARGTIRGLHYQTPPMAQAKLVRAVRGSVFDVAVDLRRASPTFGRSVSAVLSAEAGEQLLIPVGFAHGYCTLEPGTEVAYKASEFYSPEHDSGIAWDDPAIGIEWPLHGLAPKLSEKDLKLPKLADMNPQF